MHPGWADTAGALPRFYRVTRALLRSPSEDADTIVWLGAAAESAERSGGFWHDRINWAFNRVGERALARLREVLGRSANGAIDAAA